MLNLEITWKASENLGEYSEFFQNVEEVSFDGKFLRFATLFRFKIDIEKIVSYRITSK